MKKYTLSDLNPLISAEELIRKNPNKYINNLESPSFDVVSHLVADALSLSANKVTVNNVNGWYFVSANKNWVCNNIEKIDDFSEIFRRLIAIPERGANSFRGEILAFVFSQDCFVYEDGKICVIKGSEPSDNVIGALPSDLSFSVCFTTDRDKKGVGP